MTTKVRADESLKKLFSLSKRPTIDLINGLFGEKLQAVDTELTPKNIEFVSADLSVIFADWVISAEQGQVSKQFHIEFQIANPASMIIRMFEYGFHIARESAQTKDKKVFLRYPKQLVLYLERDDSLEEDISCIVEFPPYTAESRFEYKVPVKKFWNISVEELKDQLYALIPFNVFTSRKRMADIHNDKSLSPEEKSAKMNEEFLQVKRIIQSSQEHLLSIYGADKIKEDDLNKMTTVTHNLMEHLYEKFYVYNNSFPQEVQHMLDSVLNVEALKESRKRGKVEGNIDALLQILNAKKLADEDILSRVQKEKDPERLTRWILAAATVNTVKDFKTAIHENE